MSITCTTEHRREPAEVCGSAIFAGEYDGGSRGTTPITLAKTIPNGRKLSLIQYDNPARASDVPFWARGGPDEWQDGLPPALYPFNGELVWTGAMASEDRAGVWSLALAEPAVEEVFSCLEPVATWTAVMCGEDSMRACRVRWSKPALLRQAFCSAEPVAAWSAVMSAEDLPSAAPARRTRSTRRIPSRCSGAHIFHARGYA